MPESVCFSMIFGNGLGRSFSPSSNSSWCTCFTYPCGSRRKPSADKRNFVVIRPPPAGLVQVGLWAVICCSCVYVLTEIHSGPEAGFAVKCLPCAYQDFERFGGGV